MHLDHVRAVSPGLSEHLRNIISHSKEHIHADREISSPDHRSTAFLKISDDLFLDVCPACSTYNHCLEVFCKELIVLPDSSRSREIDAHTLLGKGRVGLGDSLSPACILNTL